MVLLWRTSLCESFFDVKAVGVEVVEGGGEGAENGDEGGA